jgi:hypothetical protein
MCRQSLAVKNICHFLVLHAKCPLKAFERDISVRNNSFIDKPLKDTSLEQSTSFEQLGVQIGSVGWSVEREKKKDKVK